ncbi:MAG: RagB/SusD family nutrient uptake outer membrane protein [Prevotellaceae bacterium]|jgi:hypothetical protein|nr:RagB/SusD family nutrient uptake outer membrane protein [Prevotellaceae bacterium]
MKTKYILAISALSLTLAYACGKDDDDSPEAGNIITTEVIKTNAQAQAAGNGVWGPLQTLSSSFSFLLESTSETTVSFEGEETAGGPVASRLETDAANSYTTKIYTRLYSSIGTANRVIEQLDSSKVTDRLNQSTKDLVKARVKFARALSYLYLVQLYGEVPLILSTADATDATVSKTRAAIDEVYEQIVKDLTEAEADLPDYDIIRSNPSKGAANGLLSRAYLVWGQNPLSQAEVEGIKAATADPQHSVNSERLAKAVEYADKVISSGNYDLLADYNRNFGVGGENQGNEHIFTIHHDGDDIDAQGNHQTHCPFTERFDLLTDNHIGPADVTLVDIFDSNDKRKLYSIVTELYNADEKTGTVTPDTKANYKKYEYKFPVTSPRFGKFIHRKSYTEALREVAASSEDGQPNNINRIELRYAEVLLYKAEALFFLNRAAEALPLVNQLRSRAGVASLTDLTEDALYKEWYLELSFEQKQWTNLVRWKTLIASVNKVKQYEYYKEDYKDNASVIAKAKSENSTLADTDVNAAFFAKIYKHLHAKTTNISGKHYRFPIPANGGISAGVSQNPGY